MWRLYAQLSIFFLLLISSLTVSILSSSPVLAQSYSASYNILYEQSQTDAKSTHAVYEVTLTNNANNTYIDNYRISFPSVFPITNIVSHDLYGTITPQLITDKDLITMQFTLHEPSIGKGTSNILTIEFDHKNTVDSYGLVTEYLVPVIAASPSTEFTYKLKIPEAYTKVSKADPLPDRIEKGIAEWKNPQKRFIYLSFSDTQYYNLHLNYHLSNSENKDIITEIALPPDTGYQKVFLEHIEPLPQSMHRDDDGNLLASYRIKPDEEYIVQSNMNLLMARLPQSEVMNEERRLLRTQKEYLLNPNNLWNIGSTQTNFDNVEKIYTFVTKKLVYDPEEVNTLHKRTGAFLALQTVDKALCTEFSDSFIAIARKKGIYTRELQGYALNHGVEVQPTNLNNILLHSWQEYYDTELGRWIQIDATWQNTSGVNYFNTLDLNHIVFVRHGKEESYPLPAGMYGGEVGQSSRTNDVIVEPTNVKPREVKKIAIVNSDIQKKIEDGSSYRGTVRIQNEGNTYRYNLQVRLKSSLLAFSRVSLVTIPVLAPYEEVKIEFDYNTRTVIFQPKNTSLTIEIGDTEVRSYPIAITPRSYSTTLSISFSTLLVLVLIWLGVRRLKKV